MKKKLLTTILILFIAISATSSYITIKPANATVTGILADNLNNVLCNVDWTAVNSWTTNWAVILASQDETVFENAIIQDIQRGDYLDALYVARLAELSGYFSETITQAKQIALEHIAMCGSLPITANANSYGDPDALNSGCYLVYNRNTLWAYTYAAECGLGSKWDANQAFIDLAKAYDKPPTGSVSGEMLWCDPQENWARSYSSRYYDEHAQTLSVFLKLAEQGVPEAMNYADAAWSGIQAHWNKRYQYYGYTSTTTVECEMGNFAQIIAEYQDLKGVTIPYWDRVIQDLNYKLLAKSWSSPGWAVPGVLVHSTSNPELRLWETMGATIALQTQYPYFTDTMKTNWANMLMGSSPAWQGLLQSSLNSDGQFRGTSGSSISNEATICAAATLFLYGIVPKGGNLDIPNIEEFYNDLRTPFSISDFKFDYANHLIKIPVKAGEITFIYGTAPVSYTFPTDGVYTIQFSDDWNLITQVNTTPVITNPPDPPTNLQAVAGDAKVTLTWTAPTENGGTPITGYTLYKGTNPEALSETIPLNNVDSYVDTAVTNDVTYYYCVVAVNAVGESANSNFVSATPTAPTIKSMTTQVATDQSTYVKGSAVAIQVTVKDASTDMPLSSASVDVSIFGPKGNLVQSLTGVTDLDGISLLSYMLPSNAQKGTYTVKATVTCAGYEASFAQTTFKI